MFKVSIREGILILFATLLIGVGSAIMLVNYATGEDMLLNITKGLVELSYNNISERITSFLQPLNERIDIGVRAIDENLIIPKRDEKFTKFLVNILGDSPNFYGIHWSDPKGDFYYVERNGDGTLTNDRVICNDTCIETVQKINRSGSALNSPKIIPPKYDPRKRPWYVEASAAKRYILSDIYVFFHHPQVGITAAYPLYENGKLRGILSIDETLSALSSFVANIKITQNSNVFIFTKNDELVAAKSLQNSKEHSVHKVTSIDIPWVQESFRIYKASNKTLFSYRHNGERYLAYYRSIQNVVDNPWYIAIVLPITDVVGGLREILTVSALIATLVLLVGMLLVSIISKTISRPIVKLADEAALIEQMNLAQIDPLPASRFKEINFVQETFNSMKQSLNSFMRYVPATLVKKLITSGDVAHVGGENKEVTFLFADIENFTTLTENANPQDVMYHLSQYFEVMTKIILDHQGTVDKYIGDAIMAFWGAPLDDQEHAVHACQCAMEMQKEISKMNEKLVTEGRSPISIRVGINTGVAVIGNVGSKDRLSYTALGDSVNLASRLEGLNKVYHSKIIVGENTYLQVKNQFKFRLLDQVVVRGKNKSVHVYELLYGQSNLHDESNVYDPMFLEAFAAYQKGEWDRAITLFKKLNNLYADDYLAQLYIERCKNFMLNPPEKWEGIWRIS